MLKGTEESRGRVGHPPRPNGRESYQAQTLNRYAYVANDPINLVDSNGTEMRGNLMCLLDDHGDCVGGSYFAGCPTLDGFLNPSPKPGFRAQACGPQITSKNKGDVIFITSPWVFVLVVVYKLSYYALPALNPACSICSRAASAVEWMPCTLSLKSSGLLAFSRAVS